MPVKLLYRQWKQSDATLLAISAVYRWIEQSELDATAAGISCDSIPGSTKTFEAPGVNDLWIVDFSPRAFPGAGTHDHRDPPVPRH